MITAVITLRTDRMTPEELSLWKDVVLAVQECAEIALVQREADDNDDIIFPDVDGPSFADPNEHSGRRRIVSISIPEVFNMRNEIFEADIPRVKASLATIENVTVSNAGDIPSGRGGVVVRLA